MASMRAGAVRGESPGGLVAGVPLLLETIKRETETALTKIITPTARLTANLILDPKARLIAIPIHERCAGGEVAFAS